MHLEVRPYLKGDIDAIVTSDGKKSALAGRALGPEAYEGPAVTIWRGLDRVACGGLVHIWEGRALAWAFAGALTLREYAELSRFVSNYLEDGHKRWVRIEAHIDPDERGHKAFASRVGFEFECRLERAAPNNASDILMYARFSDGGS